MNGFDQFMNGLFKKIEPWVGLGLQFVMAIAGNFGIVALRNQHVYTGDTGGYTFFIVIYWIVVSCAFICKLLQVIHEVQKNKPVGYNQGYPQQQFAQPQQPPQGGFNGVANQQAAPAASPFCTKCGAKIPQGSQFCTNCGNRA